MEKIYMEENKQKKQSAFMRTMGSKVPHHLSALMILVAFASFIAIGFSGGHESYAMTQDLGDRFQTAPAATDGSVNILRGDASSQAPGIQDPFQLTRVYTSTGTQIFCLDRNKYFPTNSQWYKRGDLITDPGLMYVLTHTKANSDYQITDYETKQPLPDVVQSWITQVAIWAYTGELTPEQLTALKIRSDDPSSPGDVALSTGNEPTNFQYHDQSNYQLYDTYVKPILEQAKSATSSQVSIPKPEGNLTVTSDNKYYKTPIITVNGLTSGKTYSMEFKDAPTGIKAYRTNGTEITDLKNVSSADNQFYLLIPIEKATAATKQFTVTVNAPSAVAYVYNPEDTTANLQRVTAVVDGTTSVGVTLSYTPVVPDTGMNKAQSIYFIGLVVLLCGIGIIYANTKPKKASE